MATERTLILVKPDAFERRLTGEVIARFERKGLRLVALKLMQADEEIAERPLRGAHRQAVLRRARRVHHRRPAGRDGARGGERREGRAPADRRDRTRSRPTPARSAASSPPRSPSTSSTARTRTSRPSARSGSGSPSSESSPRARLRGAPCSRPWVSSSRCASPEVEEDDRGASRGTSRSSGTRAARPRPSRRRRGDALVIAGDTEVVIDGEVLGTAADEAEARAHLERLSGRAHQVLGGLALLGPAEVRGAPHRGRRADGRLQGARSRSCSSATSPSASGAGGPAPTRSRDWARRWSPGSSAGRLQRHRPAGRAPASARTRAARSPYGTQASPETCGLWAFKASR